MLYLRHESEKQRGRIIIVMSPKMKINDVYAIKKNVNPDKVIADGIKIGDLNSKSYQEKVNIFSSRIQVWFFDTMKPLIEATTASNFLLISTSCILIDLFSQYRYGRAYSTRQSYIEFIEKHFSEYNHSIDPPIISCHYNACSKKWEKDKIKSVAEAIYHCFRCGVLHSARIMEYGRINREFEEEVIRILQWGQSNKKEINIHAPAFFLKLEKVFHHYINILKNESDEEYKINFLRRFNFEYGIVEKYKNNDLIISS